jgi:hypothetical protein
MPDVDPFPAEWTRAFAELRRDEPDAAPSDLRRRRAVRTERERSRQAVAAALAALKGLRWPELAHLTYHLQRHPEELRGLILWRASYVDDDRQAFDEVMAGWREALGEVGRLNGALDRGREGPRKRHDIVVRRDAVIGELLAREFTDAQVWTYLKDHHHDLVTCGGEARLISCKRMMRGYRQRHQPAAG